MLFALVDCNNFYVSCERVFRPEWRDLPVGVLSNNDGCIVARSEELKRAGIPMGAPYFKYREKLKALKAVIVSSNYALYGDMSSRVMSTLAQYNSSLEVYSIDEAWLPLAQVSYENINEYAENIARNVRRDTGIEISIGIAPTKVLAKIANRYVKKNLSRKKIKTFLDHNMASPILAEIGIEDVWGIGRGWGARLKALGIRTALELRESDPLFIRRNFGVVVERLVYELRGISCLGREEFKPRQQIIASRSFGERVLSLDTINVALASHCDRAAQKLRSQDSACGVIQVYLRTGAHSIVDHYYSNTYQIKLPYYTADTAKLIHYAKLAAQKIYKPGYRYAKTGVMLFDIVQRDNLQLNLFYPSDSEETIKIMNAIDRINYKYGSKTLYFADSGGKNRSYWQMKRNLVSPSYTTNWDEIPKVR
jgi:DNA polymerase V